MRNGLSVNIQNIAFIISVFQPQLTVKSFSLFLIDICCLL